MEEFFRSLKTYFRKALALWILNHQDLISDSLDVIFACLGYLQKGVYCLTLPYQFVKLVIQNLKKGSK